MIDYIELNLTFKPFYPSNEIVTLWLSDIGYESFLEENEVLKAYIPKSDFNYDAVKALLEPLVAQGIKVNFTHLEIPGQNWNQVWEDSFEPVLLAHLSIVAPFHGTEYRTGRVIEIAPKMSFGTGHHQTTYLMCQAMEELVFTNKKVLDMGTGTGILAINAVQLGADHVLAVDIESWSVENTIENVKRNQCTRIEAREGDIHVVTEVGFDVILANINRNVLLRHLGSYYDALSKEGVLLISGFFTSDVKAIEIEATLLGFKRINTYEKENWACILFEKY
ncbi:MAG: 50S ribosomal protein L11 methyltransferase [Flavobacteriales bacterium]